LTTVSKRLLGNLGANSLGKGLNILSQILLVPLFLKFWGVELYGEWLILSTIPAYLVISDFGLGHASANEMAIKVSQGLQNKALEIFQATAMLIAVMFLVVGICFAIILMIVPLNEWLNFIHIERHEMLLVILFLSLKVLVSQQFGLYHSAFRCIRRNAFGTMLKNALLICQLIGISAALIIGVNPWQLALIDLSITSIALLLVRLLMWVQIPWVRYGFPKNIRKVIKPIFYPALAFLIFPFTQLILIQGTTIVTGILLGPTAVVLYTTVRMLGNVSLRLLEIVTISVWPEISVAFGKRDLVQMRKLHRYGAQIVLWLSIIGFTLLLFIGEYVYLMWTGNNVEWEQAFFMLMILAIFLESLQIFSKVIPTATNQHVRMIVWLLINALISLPFLWGFIVMYGIIGISFMLILHNTVLSIVVLAYALRQLEEKPFDYFVYLISPYFLYNNVKKSLSKVLY